MKPRYHSESSREHHRSKLHGVSANVRPMQSFSPAGSTSGYPGAIKKKRGRPSRRELELRDGLLATKANSDRSDSPSLPPILTPESDSEISPPPKKDGATCHVCGKRFKRPVWLTHHLQSLHPDEAPPPPTGVPIASLKASILSTSAPLESRRKHDHKCPQCDWKFKNPDRLAMHLAQHHGMQATKPTKQPTPTKQALSSDDTQTLDGIQQFFDSISVNQSARIVRELESILKHTNQFVRHLNAEILSPDTSANFEQLLQSNRGLLAKQQELYEAASQLISVKKDSLKFAFEDWVQKNSPDPADIEDYSTFKMETDFKLELNEDGTIVTDKKIIDKPTNGETAPPVPSCKDGNVGECIFHANNGGAATKVDLKDVECQTNIQACDLHLSDYLESNGEYEFLDSKTGMYMTNKVEVIESEEEEQEEEVGGKPGEEGGNEDMVELIEVDDEYGDEDEELVEMTITKMDHLIPLAPIKSIKTYVPSKHTPPLNCNRSTTAPNQLATLAPLPSQIRNALLDVVADPGGRFKCIECSFSCVNSSGLIPHYKQTHLHGRTEKCKQCERLFIDSIDLQKHVRLAHTIRPALVVGPRRFPCKHPRCPSVFSSVGDMHSHMRTHFKNAQIRPIARK